MLHANSECNAILHIRDFGEEKKQVLRRPRIAVLSTRESKDQYRVIHVAIRVSGIRRTTGVQMRGRKCASVRIARLAREIKFPPGLVVLGTPADTTRFLQVTLKGVHT